MTNTIPCQISYFPLFLLNSSTESVINKKHHLILYFDSDISFCDFKLSLLQESFNGNCNLNLEINSPQGTRHCSLGYLNGFSKYDNINLEELIKHFNTGTDIALFSLENPIRKRNEIYIDILIDNNDYKNDIDDELESLKLNFKLKIKDSLEIHKFIGKLEKLFGQDFCDFDLLLEIYDKERMIDVIEIDELLKDSILLTVSDIFHKIGCNHSNSRFVFRREIGYLIN